MNAIDIDLPARIHLTLLDMSTSGYRRHGGVGFAISPGYTCKALHANCVSITDFREGTIENSIQVRSIALLLELECARRGLQPISFCIQKGYDAHCGFGSGTALRLAALEALYILNGIEYDEAMLISGTGRGGVSGIGIRTYFSGGLWVDLGVKSTGCSEFYSSDSVSNISPLPLALPRMEMPAWPIGLLLPKNDPQVSAADEEAFFRSFRGASASDVSDVVYQALMGIVPAVLECDLEIFNQSLANIQAGYWKRAERKASRHASWLEGLHGVVSLPPIAMSSMGPASFFVGRDINSVKHALNAAVGEAITALVFPSNSGRTIKHA